MRIRTLLVGLELTLLLVAALGGLLFQLTLPAREATDADYQGVARVLSQEAQEGDVVLLFPWWAERARLFVPSGLPVVGYLHDEGDPLTAHPRIWVLAEPHLPYDGAAAFERAFLPGRTAEGAPRTFGKLTLTLYRNARARPVLFSATDAVARAHVYLERPDGAREDCAFDGRAHQCPGGLHVGAEWHELFYEPRRCLWMHPPGGPTRLVAEFPDVPAGASTLLEGGIIWELAPKREVTPLEVGLDTGPGSPTLAALHVPGGLEGMQHAQLTAAAARSLRVWTQSDQGEARDACVELRVFGPGGQT